MRPIKPLLLTALFSIPVTVATVAEEWVAEDWPQDPRTRNAPGSAQDPDQDRPGIPVRNQLVIDYCASCHEQDREGLMGRISYMRKSPEGWSISMKRMVRLYEVEATPGEAREMVRYLANDHGLARSEAERGLYESERRVHWSEQHHDQERLQACASCHSLGRILNQQRDAEEWKQLKATHLAYFPVSRQSIGSAFPEENRGRRGGRGNRGGGNGEDDEGGNDGDRPQGDLGDRVLAGLAEELPLFTDAWKDWSVNRREVPLAGEWTVTGHEIGRGDLLGRVTLRRLAEDDYETIWNARFQNGERIQRTGRGLLYAGYSWRGRSEGPGGASWREVLLVDDEWRHMKGRFFTGNFDELGLDVELHRHIGLSQIFAIGNRAVKVPSTGHVLDVHGESFPDTIDPSAFSLGEGVTATAAERVSADHVRLTVSVAPDADVGERLVSFGVHRGSKTIVLYDRIDYLRVTPLQGLARVGGGAIPKQYERFEAVAVNRGPDDKPYTDDDYDVMVVRNPRWSLEEFPVRENDDDLQYVGSIDQTGMMYPAIDGPNPERKWRANNVGEVYVVAEARLEDRDFKARAHLVVTVPLYRRANALEWEDADNRDNRDDR